MSSLYIAGTAVALGSAYILSKFCKSSKPPEISNEEFWYGVRNVESAVMTKGQIIVHGNRSFSSLKAAQKTIFLYSTNPSKFLVDHAYSKVEAGSNVLDLGSGTGANSLPLCLMRCNVVAIDKMVETTAIYRKALSDLTASTTPKFITGDITSCKYPEGMDLVICEDTLPYIKPVNLQTTLEKIFKALRPGGFFVGTIFFEPAAKDPDLDILRKIGAHFYPSKEMALEIISRSGFEIRETQEKESKPGHSNTCVHFLAVKPKKPIVYLVV